MVHGWYVLNAICDPSGSIEQKSGREVGGGATRFSSSSCPFFSGLVSKSDALLFLSPLSLLVAVDSIGLSLPSSDEKRQVMSLHNEEK